MEKKQQDILYKYCFRITEDEDFARQTVEACSNMNLKEAYKKATRLAAELRGRKTEDPDEVQNRLLAWINSPQRLLQLISFLDELPAPQQAVFVMRHQAEMSIGAIADYSDSDHCTVVAQIMKTEKVLLSKMELPENTPLPKVDGKPFWKAVLEMSH